MIIKILHLNTSTVLIFVEEETKGEGEERNGLHD